MALTVRIEKLREQQPWNEASDQTNYYETTIFSSQLAPFAI
jgi:hypothetical protein